MRILIAEDEVSIAKALKVMLERNKYVVDAVYNGTDAVDYACTNVYDALILDIMMPGMDGIAALTAIRGRGSRGRSGRRGGRLSAEALCSQRISGARPGADPAQRRLRARAPAARQYDARLRAVHAVNACREPSAQ